MVANDVHLWVEQLKRNLAEVGNTNPDFKNANRGLWLTRYVA